MIIFQPNFQRLKKTGNSLLDSNTVFLFPWVITNYIGLRNGEIGAFFSDNCQAERYDSIKCHFLKVRELWRGTIGIRFPDCKMINGKGWYYGDPCWYNFNSLLRELRKNKSLKIICLRPDPPYSSVSIFLSVLRDLDDQ